MYNFSALILVFLLIFAPNVQSNEQTPDNVNTVEQFVAAFNAQDSDAMASLVVDDIEWLSIVGNKVIVEVKGKNNLIESMNNYFQSCLTCKSKLSKIVSTKSRVSAVEVASWQGKSGPMSQSAVSVYEFSEGLITRVYYFQAEK
ncbi:nuclear transport factor 2 family protein [Colwellia sp. 1_MG-2023]|uniref:nuclear transport factor 2 family protein n=1 Tax=Colwellia sp. 1_MG-2023 TaxID=3062649 RepID=UPI0026E28C7A|nr:nuclear transport factor 2 family protein [Colwellia sp. 1_MG-2023]MDO6445094.1 nuclear transport factor 2 family protein [Colwellia sp. 1_MG-2023]